MGYVVHNICDGLIMFKISGQYLSGVMKWEVWFKRSGGCFIVFEGMITFSEDFGIQKIWISDVVGFREVLLSHVWFV